MKKNTFLLLIFSIFLSFSKLTAQTTIPVFDQVLFHDGYATLVDQPVPDGVIKHRNDLFATKLSEAQLNLFGDSITMKVLLKAACDNYDRIGYVNLAFVPKGETSYQPNAVKRIELARFITPFMNKNKNPDTVPYVYQVDYLKHIFKDRGFLQQYDFWLELQVFGVPYAAQTQVSGCSGRNDVFYGSLQFITSTPAVWGENGNVLIPLFFQQNFNNHQANATDELGRTVKSDTFTVVEDLEDVHLVLITSNHGANTGGEEYNRRWHYVYLDNENVLTYKPGRTSCEPFRMYNTQGNGIYGPSPKTDAQWQSFSNWCPGDIIDTRVIKIDSLSAGEHIFKIEVPEAVFVNGQGNIPLSVYLLGKTKGSISIGKQPTETAEFFQIYPNPAQKSFTINSNRPIKNVIITNSIGKKVLESHSKEIDVENLSSGIYFVFVESTNGYKYTCKLVKQ